MQITPNDVVIVGASLVGASCAIALHQLGLKVAIIDAKPVQIDLTVMDSRVYAVSVRNIDWLNSLNIWQRSDIARSNAIEKMQIWSDAGGEIVLDAFQANALSLGSIVENNQLLNAMHEALNSLGIERITGKVTSIAYKADVAILSGDFEPLQTRLVVAADGANSWVRTNAGIGVTLHDYAHQGVVANFKLSKPHGNIARQWFKGKSVLALLPMPNDTVSMVWSTDNAHAAHLLALNAAEFADEVINACENALGELQLITPAKAYPLQALQADSLTAERLVLIGDAAHTIHPLAGQGVNLGFRDVIALVDALKAAPKHIDAPRTLTHFARSRQPDMLAMRSLTHGLQALFLSDLSLAKKVRHIGFDWLQKQAQFKVKLMHVMLNN